MKRPIFRTLLATLSFFVISSTVATADTMAYMAVYPGGDFGTIDLDTGVFTLLGNSGVTLAGLGVVNGKLYGTSLSNGNGNLYTVNPANGSLALVGASGISYDQFGGTTNRLFAIGSDANLYSINPTNGAATLVGPIGIPFGSWRNISCNAGTLYAAEGAYLYTINTTNGAASLVGNMGGPQLGAMLLVNGILYGGQETPGAHVDTLNPSTGAATVGPALTGASAVFGGLAPYPLAALFEPVCTNVTVTLSGTTTNCTTATNIVGWWKADNNLLDSSGNGNNGSTPNSIHYVTGISAQAFQLGLYNTDMDQNIFTNYHRVDLGALPQLYSASGFTMAGWVRLPHLGAHEVFSLPASIPSSPSTNSPFYSITQNFGCQANVGLAVEFSMGLENGVVLTNNAPGNTGYFTSTNAWLHLAFTWNNGDGLVKTYTNGILAQTTSNSLSIGHTLPTLAQRSHQGAPVPAVLGEGVQLYAEPDAPIWRDQNNWETQIDEFQLYNRALTSNEIARVFNGDPTVTNLTATACVSAPITTNLVLCTAPKGELTILHSNSANVLLEWPAQNNSFYLLQSSDELTPLSWTQLWAGTGAGTNVIVNDPTLPRQKRFYRLLSNE